MAWNISSARQGVTPELEIFKFPPNAQGFASIVLDAAAVAPDSDGRRTLKAGTILTKNPTTNQYERYTGDEEQENGILGILARTIEFVDGTSKSDQPADMAFHGEVFRADRIIDFVTHQAELATSLPTCRFL